MFAIWVVFISFFTKLKLFELVCQSEIRAQWTNAIAPRVVATNCKLTHPVLPFRSQVLLGASARARCAVPENSRVQGRSGFPRPGELAHLAPPVLPPVPSSRTLRNGGDRQPERWQVRNSHARRRHFPSPSCDRRSSTSWIWWRLRGWSSPSTNHRKIRRKTRLWGVRLRWRFSPCLARPQVPRRPRNISPARRWYSLHQSPQSTHGRRPRSSCKTGSSKMRSKPRTPSPSQ